MSMYLLTPEEAAQEAFTCGDSSAYTKLAASKIAEKKENGIALADWEQDLLDKAIKRGW